MGHLGAQDLFCRAALCPSLYGGRDRCWTFPTPFSDVGFFIFFCWSSWDYCLATSSFEIPLNSSSECQSIEHSPQFGFAAKRKMPLVIYFHLIPTFSAQDFWKFSIKLLGYVFHPHLLNLPISKLWKSMSKALKKWKSAYRALPLYSTSNPFSRWQSWWPSTIVLGKFVLHFHTYPCFSEPGHSFSNWILHMTSN